MASESAREIIDYAGSLDCIHCGLCLRTCPTYQLTGRESSSPRGRIHLMRAVAEERQAADADFREEMEFCLVCRNCESACPAGVRFGAMMEQTREHMQRGPLERAGRWLGFRVLLPNRWALRTAFGVQRFLQRTSLWALATRCFGPTRGAAMRSMPALPSRRESRSLPSHTKAQEVPDGPQPPVALLEGCVMPELFGRVNRATASALSKLGIESRVPAGVVCCGSLHAHNGDRDGARQLAKRMIESFEKHVADDGSPLTIVTNSAGCGSHMRELENLFEPSDPWHSRAKSFSERVRDFSEIAAPRLSLLAEQGVAPSFAQTPFRDATGVAWDDPCHLCHGQGIRQPPRAVLDAIDGVPQRQLREPESCCGSAGIYSLLRPADGADILAGKLDDLASSGADVLVTANPGCHLQWETGLRRAGSATRVVHLAELLDQALPSSGG